jgi:hypothetical protein
MSTSPTTHDTAFPGPAEPAREVARFFPAQGTWSEEEYLALKGNRLVEFTHGYIEVLALPTMAHQLIVAFLLFAPLRVRLWPGKFREPGPLQYASDHLGRTIQHPA